MKLSTTFHPQTDGQADNTIYTFEDMFRYCVIYFQGYSDDHLPLIVCSYNNSYPSSIQMTLFEALYGRRCRSPIDWFEVGDVGLIGSYFIHKTMEKVRLIPERLKMVQSHEKTYVDVRRT